MLTVTLNRNGEFFYKININISHIREKNTWLEYPKPVAKSFQDTETGEIVYYEDFEPAKMKVYDQFGGYTIGAYSLPHAPYDDKPQSNPHEHNRIVISRCSPKDNYDRHKGIMCCIEKVVEKLWPEENFTLVPVFNERNRLISADKSIVIDLQ